jgi:hypothetical protein
LRRGNSRLTAAKNYRSAAQNVGPPDVTTQDGQLMTERDDLEVLRRS